MQGRVILGSTSTKLGLMSCSRTQRSDAPEAQTRGPSVLSQALSTLCVYYDTVI